LRTETKTKINITRAAKECVIAIDKSQAISRLVYEVEFLCNFSTTSASSSIPRQQQKLDGGRLEFDNE